MAKTFTAPFAQTPKTAVAVATGAATVSNGSPTNTVLLVTSGSDGSILTKLTAVPTANVALSSLLLYLSKDAGTTKILIDSALMAANTLYANTAVPVTTFSSYSETTPMRLEASDRLYVGSQVALTSGIIFKAEYTDF